MASPKLLAYSDDSFSVQWPQTSLLHRQWVPESSLSSFYSSATLLRVKQTLPAQDSTLELKAEAWLRMERFQSVPPSHPHYRLHTIYQDQSDTDTLVSREAVLVKWIGLSFTVSTWEWKDDPRVAIPPKQVTPLEQKFAIISQRMN